MTVIEVELLNTKVYERLKEEIRLQILAPGQLVTIRHLAERYGVSTTPVREALRQLQSEGLVTYQRRCIVIRQLSVDEVEKIFKIREKLETLALAWAIESIDDKAVSQLVSILDAMDQAAADQSKWRELNREFHLHIYSFAHSDQLVSMIQNLWSSIEPYMNLYTAEVESLEVARVQHRAIVDRLAEGDLAGATRLVQDHLQHTAEIIVAALKEQTATT